MRPCNITPAVILHILNEMRQCNITPIINKENSYTNVILHGRFQKNFAALDFGANAKAPARLDTLPSACPCGGLSLLLPRLPKPAPNLNSMEESRETYFVGEIIICGTPEGVHEIATLRPASLPAERITALYFARSVFAFGLSGFTEKEVKRSTLPGFKPAMAFTSACGALDFRPRFANSASFSGISSNSKLSEVISFPFGRNEFLTNALVNS